MSGLSPNPSQRQVMDCRERLCVVAGAGSGKTGTLVECIVLRLEESLGSERPLDICEVLALTFTDKAAAEMRQRLAAAFERRRRQSAEAETAGFWRRQSSRLDRADIGTIHGFALKLIRENPLELGLTGAPDLEEDGRSLALDVEEIIRDWLDEEYADLLGLLEVYRLPTLQSMLVKSAATMSSWGLGGLSADLSPVEEDHAPAVLAFKSLVREALDLVENGDLNRSKPYYAKVSSAMRALAAEVGSATPEELAAELDRRLPLWGGLLKDGGDWYSKQGRPMRRRLNEALSQMLARRDEERARPLREKFIRLTQRLNLDLGAAKKKRGRINFDDILILARRLLARNPALRRREAGRRRLVVVDEFQDTNRLQADLLAYLLLPAADGRVLPEDYPVWREMDWPQAAENFIVFGDLKQSIYRFRGAEVDIMSGLSRRFQEGGGRVIALDRNYRSQAPLVAFFNALFADSLGPAFSDLDRQDEQRPPLYPGPHIINLSSPPESRPPLSPDRARVQAALLTGYLADLFSGRLGVLLPDDEGRPRKPRPGDVAILFRAFGRAPLFKEAIIEAGWNCRLAASDNPFDYVEVKALLAACQFLWGIEQEISLAAVLRSPLGPVSDLALSLLAWPGPKRTPLSDYFLNHRPWPDGLPREDRETLESLRLLLSELRPLRGRLKPVEIMERLAEERQLLPLAALEADGDDRVRAVTGFLGLSRGAGLSEKGRRLGPVEELREMRRQWDPRRDGGSGGPAAEAVTLMTVHAAKGLEFPVVVVAEADRKGGPPSDPLVISADGRLALRFKDPSGRQIKTADYLAIEAEEKIQEKRESARLLYVAATRARDQLVFLGWPDPKRNREAPETAPDEEAGRKAWLESVLDCPEASAMMEVLEYEPSEVPPTAEGSSAKPPEETPPPAPPSLLEAMTLKSWTLPVTALGKFLADPEIFRANILGLEEDSDWQPGRPFFPARQGRNPKGGLSPAEAGTLFHAAMENLDPLKPEISGLLISEARRLTFNPGEAEIEDMGRRIEIFLNHPLGQAWRHGREAGRPNWRELPFSLKITNLSPILESLTLNGVIDLFFESPDGLGQIVDYKLARAKAGPELESYEHQLRIYAQALISAGYQGPLAASLYFAGGESPLVHPVELENPSPIRPLLESLKKKCAAPLNNRPLRPAFPGPLNMV